MPKSVGIDLGTTNSVVSVLEAGDPIVIPNAEGSRTTPSIVAFPETGDRLVGHQAKRQAIINPDRTLAGVKRLMGRKYRSEEISDDLELIPISDAVRRQEIARISDPLAYGETPNGETSEPDPEGVVATTSTQPEVGTPSGDGVDTTTTPEGSAPPTTSTSPTTTTTTTTTAP